MSVRELKKFCKYVSKNYSDDKRNQHLSYTEADTEDRLIKPFITKLDWLFESGDISSQLYIPFPSAKGKKHGIFPDIVLSCDSNIHIVVESKRISNQALSFSLDQVKEQFNSTPADISILTNGIQYWFYSWVFPQKTGAAFMHSTPFAVIDVRYLDLRKRDRFLNYLLRGNFDPLMLKWFNTADHINRQVRFLLKKPESRKDTRIFRTTFIQAMKKYNHHDLDGNKLTRKQLRELYNFTKYHGRRKFTHGKEEYPFAVHKAETD